ncbi:MAG: DJ-1/PfpI family protein [Betaproteobacteria bacterium]|nr:DJ-1/PfpI family protein [Betaproteobacteria bacterium]
MRAAILVYEGTEPIDLATYGVLSMARRVAPSVSMYLVARQAGPVRLANGLVVMADHGYTDAPAADVLIITGGPGWDRESKDAATIDFVRRFSKGASVAAVCTGGMILAATGLLDGKPATTKKEVTGAERSPLAILAERHPAVKALDARLVDCGPVLTGGGVTLCIDMTLHLLARFCGEEAARETARILEYSTALAANEARGPVVSPA